MPLAWLVGTWEGDGVVGYPTMAEDVAFAQHVEVSHDGRAFLLWHSRTWALDGDSRRVRPLATEVGYWRVLPSADPEGADGPAAAPVGGVEVELLLTHASGVAEMYTGRAAGGRIDLATDAVMRSPAASEYAAATRLYGQVDGDLLWAMDMAAAGHPLTPHASARLHRVDARPTVPPAPGR